MEICMKSTNARLLVVETATSAVALTVVIPTHLQTQSMAMSLKIPFDFYVGNKKLPSGGYRVSIIQDGVGQVLGYNRQDAIPSTTPIIGELVFNVYEQECFLSEVLWKGYDSGVWLVSEMEAPGQLTGRLLFVRYNNQNEESVEELQVELPVVRPCSVQHFFPHAGHQEKWPAGPLQLQNRASSSVNRCRSRSVSANFVNTH